MNISFASDFSKAAAIVAKRELDDTSKMDCSKTPTSDTVSTANSSTTSIGAEKANGVLCCDECRNVKEEVKAVREELHFLTHQIAVLMRFLSIGYCRCPTCDCYSLGTRGNVQGVAASSFANDNGHDKYFHPSYSQLLATLRLRHSQQDSSHAHVEGSNVNGSPTSTSSSPSSAYERHDAPDATSAVLPIRKRRASSSVEAAISVEHEMDTGESEHFIPLKTSANDDGCSTPKNRVIDVHQLLPKLFMAADRNDARVGDANDGHYESRQSSISGSVGTSLNGTRISSAGLSDLMDEHAIDVDGHPSLVRLCANTRTNSQCKEDGIHQSAVEDQSLVDESYRRNSVTPPAIIPLSTKDRIMMSFVNPPPSLFYPFPAFGHRFRQQISLPITCGSPTLQSHPKAEYFKDGDEDPAIEPIQSENDDSRCAVMDRTSTDLPKACITAARHSSVDNVYSRRNGTILPSTKSTPSIPVPNFFGGHDPQLQRFRDAGHTVSTALPLMTQGPRMSTFFCSICNRDFSNVYYKRHMIVHANARPYVCDVCGKRFNERSNMMKHKQRLHGP